MFLFTCTAHCGHVTRVGLVQFSRSVVTLKHHQQVGIITFVVLCSERTDYSVK